MQRGVATLAATLLTPILAPSSSNSPPSMSYSGTDTT